MIVENSPNRLKVNKALYSLHTETPTSFSQLSLSQTCESVPEVHQLSNEKDTAHSSVRAAFRRVFRIGFRP